jgi:hypothetical protein
VTALIDHLVVAAQSLDQGQAWCEATFGITPGPGGQHRLMGTHNRVFAIGSPAHPASYLEIIAIDPLAADPRRTRWFDLDDGRVQAAIAREPRLVHFVARCGNAGAAAAALRSAGCDPGELVHLERETSDGILRWQITMRGDGHRLCHGAVPSLIEWAGPHPADRMAASGVILTSFTASVPDAAQVQRAWDAIGLSGASVRQGVPELIATFASPRGAVTLRSNGA